MAIIPKDLEPFPHDRFPQAVAERRFVLVAVDESLIADLISEGLEGRNFRSNIEGLPAGAVICGIHPNPDTACVTLRFVHPDLPRVDVGRPIMQLEGTVEILDRPPMGGYGKELILDLSNCDPSRFTRADIEKFFIMLCKKIHMKRHELFWWDDAGLPKEGRQTAAHLKGTSAVQFIMTSNITIHTLDLLKAVYINIFSCKDFDADVAAQFSADWFRGEIASAKVVNRG